MKKAICVLMLIASLSALCGCSENKDHFEIRPFSCKVVISYGNESTEGVFVYEGGDTMSLELTDSEYIDGMKVQYCDGEYIFICDGISVNIPDGFNGTPVYGMFEAVKLVAESQIEVDNSTENSFKLTKDNKEYTCTVDNEKGRILEIKSDLTDIKFGY